MGSLDPLLANNLAWSESIKAQEPDFFASLAQQQSPEYLWIGCSDSRVPANQIVGLRPGEIFVHRNVANVVTHTDLNCHSVIQFAVDVLKVRHVIVVGHYGCGGVMAALTGRRLGLVDNWLRHVQDVYQKHASLVESKGELDHRADCLCELNVIEQAANVCHTTAVQGAWERGQDVTVHGWCYSLRNGLVNPLDFSVDASGRLEAAYQRALLRTRGAGDASRKPLHSFR